MALKLQYFRWREFGLRGGFRNWWFGEDMPGPREFYHKWFEQRQQKIAWIIALLLAVVFGIPILGMLAMIVGGLLSRQ